MPTVSRFLSRLRQEALRWYEILLCALLLALALSVAAPAAEQETEVDAPQCGNMRSNTAVMTR